MLAMYCKQCSFLAEPGLSDSETSTLSHVRSQQEAALQDMESYLSRRFLDLEQKIDSVAELMQQVCGAHISTPHVTPRLDLHERVGRLETLYVCTSPVVDTVLGELNCKSTSVDAVLGEILSRQTPRPALNNFDLKEHGGSLHEFKFEQATDKCVALLSEACSANGGVSREWPPHSEPVPTTQSGSTTGPPSPRVSSTTISKSDLLDRESVQQLDLQEVPDAVLTVHQLERIAEEVDRLLDLPEPSDRLMDSHIAELPECVELPVRISTTLDATQDSDESSLCRQACDGSVNSVHQQGSAREHEGVNVPFDFDI